MVGEPKETEIQILNHYYIKGMKMERKINPSLNSYKMVEKGNTLHYIDKDYQPEEQFF